MKRLSDRVALVTGSTRGIGQSIASRLATEGATVIVTGRNAEQAQSVAGQLTDNGGRAYGFALEVTNPDSVNDVFRRVQDEIGVIDILVNNAGVTKDTLLMRMSEDDWDSVLQVNVSGAYRCSRAVLRGMMKKRWGRIINVSSIVGLIGNPGQVNYAASKAALIGMTKSLAKEIASRGITVNAIAPGFIESDMTGVLSEQHQTALLDQIPMGRIGKPDEVSSCVAFLASDDASYITGHTLVVDGGMAM